MDLIERLIDEADGYGDGPVVVHDIEGLRALLREAAAEIERLRAEVETLRDGLDYLRQMQGAPDVLELRAKAARAERLAEALRELSQCDGSPANVLNAEVLAGRVRSIATKALRDHDQEAGNG